MEYNATSVFWHTDDLLRCLSDHVLGRARLARREVCVDYPYKVVVDKSNLTALCRVNRVCQLVFTPILFRHITLTDDFRGPHSSCLPMMRSLAESPWVTHTQTLTVANCRRDPHDPSFHGDVSRLIQCLSSLRQVQWIRVPLEGSTVAALVRSCDNLSTVRLNLLPCDEEIFDLDSENSIGPPPSPVDLVGVLAHLGNLTGLQEISLDGMCGHPDRWITPIAQILIASPRLQKLQLSMSILALDFHLEHRSGGLTPFKTFLLRICTLYKASGAVPLRLRSLRLGSSVHPDFPPGAAAAITDLVALDALETVYLNNNVGVHRMIEPSVIAGTDCHVPVATFLHDTPRLQRFSVSRLDAQVHDELARLDPERARKLAVAWDVVHDTVEWGPGLPPRLHFRMVKLDFRRFGPTQGLFYEVAVNWAAGILVGLVEGDEGTLEGLDVVMPLRHMQLYVELLVGAVRGLTGLRQLKIGHGRTPQGGNEEAVFRGWAEMLAVAGEALRYIGTGKRYMEVVRGEEVVKEDGTVVPLLLNMGVAEEVENVELFALTGMLSVPPFVLRDRDDL